MVASVRGASHVASGLPNQDAIAWMQESGCGLPLILAVADGHGSPSCFRSQLGSTIAVRVAIAVLGKLVTTIQTQYRFANFSAEKMANEEIGKYIHRCWQDEVRAHLIHHPIMLSEWKKLFRLKGKHACQRVLINPMMAYGSTILVALVLDDLIMLVQLGDGDIMIVDDNGHVSCPVPRDSRHMGNETTSLCISEAWKDCQVVILDMQQSQTVMVILSTDGYSNSFQTEAGFHKVGNDLWKLLNTKSCDYISSHLPAWLQDASIKGSGDDITVGVAYRHQYSRSLMADNGEKDEVKGNHVPIARHRRLCAIRRKQTKMRRFGISWERRSR